MGGVLLASTVGKTIIRTVTAGNASGDVGFGNGNGFSSLVIGSVSPLTEPSGLTITELIDDVVGSNSYFSVAGNHTGAIFTSITINGVTKLRSAAAVPAGTFMTTYTYWVFVGKWNMTTGNTYPITWA